MELRDEGVRLDHATPDFVAASQNIRPLRDHIVVEPLEWAGVRPGSKLIAIRHGAPVRGRILAVGPGRYEKRYSRVDKDGQKKRSYTLKRTYIPTQVKVGDIVELGGLEIGGYLFSKINWGGRNCLICQEQDVCGVWA